MSEEKIVSANLTVTMSDIQREMELLRLEREKLSVERNIVALDELRNTNSMPGSMNGKLALAKQYSISNLIPDAYKNKPENIFIAFAYAEMLGINSPMSALLNIYVVNGRPSASSDSMLGVCFNHPLFLDYEHVGDEKTSTSRITRKMPNGKERVFERTHTVEMSKDKIGKFPQWDLDRANMLRHRSDSKVCRTAFPEIFAGIHIPDEINDDNSIEVQDGSGNKTGTIKKESLQQNVINNDIFASAKVKEVPNE